MEMENKMLTLEKFEEASEVVKKVTQETKLVYSDFYSRQTGNKVYLKPENMQFTGAYKLRGAYYKLSTLKEVMRPPVPPPHFHPQAGGSPDLSPAPGRRTAQGHAHRQLFRTFSQAA